MKKITLVVCLFLGCFLLVAQPSKTSKTSNEQPISKQLDQQFAAIWKKEKLTPSRLTSDVEFLRRIWIDLVGEIPSESEVLSFLKDTDRNKRKKKIDELLEGPLYARNWANIWQAWLIGRNRMRFGQILKNALHPWLEDAFAKNVPYDSMVRQMISAEGVSDENGETVFLLRWSDSPANMAGQTTRLFLGVRLQCAQCHDHPYQKYTQTDFWSMAAFFARVRRQPVKGVDGKTQAVELLEGRRGDVTLPDTEKVITPKFILGDTPEISNRNSRREILAKLVADPKNKYFSHTLVNRLWAHFFGVGFVNPIDDFSDSNKPTHPEILELLSNDFVDHGFDLKRLIRVITNTNVYQLSSVPSKNNQKDEHHFSKALARSMTPEELFYSLVKAADVEEVMKARPNKGETLEQFLQNALNRFTFIFDNDEMNEATHFEGTITQALFFMNGRLTNDILLAKEGALMKILDHKKDPEERIDSIFLSTLARMPEKAERRKLVEYVQSHENKPKTYQDVFWALLNSTEFLLNR